MPPSSHLESTVPTLFTLPISPSADPSAHITCTTPRPNIYLLSLHSPPDNRLTPPLIYTLSLALSTIHHKHNPGVVITTSSLPKFYSNGLDYASAVADPAFFSAILFPLFRQLITYPMPTVALMNGHVFAAGLMLTMFHDYRVMNPSHGFACLNELDFGAPLLPPMASVFRVKLPKVHTLRDMTLESKRYPAREAVREGIVDAAGGLEEVLNLIGERRLVEKAKSGSYGAIKQEIYRDILRDIDEFSHGAGDSGEVQKGKEKEKAKL